MPKIFRFNRPDADTFAQRINRLISAREVRPVVTPSGHRARGRFPSLKGQSTNFESLVEEDAWRIFEIASCVHKIHTHPYTLELRADNPQGKRFIYTPDAVVTFAGTAALVEVKGDWLLRLPKPRAKLARTLRALRREEVPILLMTESDIRPAGLQDELKALLKVRPACTRLRKNIDTCAWDPTSRVVPNAETLRRWRAAQQECDALLDRVMRRDPDELVEAI